MCIDYNLEKIILFFSLLILFEKLLDRPDFTQGPDFTTFTLRCMLNKCKLYLNKP